MKTNDLRPKYVLTVRETNKRTQPCDRKMLETYAYLKSIYIDSEADTDYVYMDIGNLIIDLILNKTIL